MKNARFESYEFRNGKATRNRVVVPPMASQTANRLGKATPQTLSHYHNLSQSGAGLVFVEYSFIHSSGRGEENQLGIDSDDKTEGLSKIAQTIHQQESLAGIQIVHVGGKTSTSLAGTQPIGPSAIPVPVKGWTPDTPREATLNDIQNLKSWYIQAAGRASDAGFDFVELHAAHGYGLNQWLSPLTNQRTDKYGGCIENQARFLLEVISEIKEKFPELLLGVRLPAQDHMAGGLMLKDMVWVVKELEALNVDLIDVSSGLGGWRRTDDRKDQGYLVKDAAILKKATQLPVVGVGGILDGETIDHFIVEKKIDFAAVGRAILNHPKQWGEINLNRPNL